MVRRVKSYLSELEVISDEGQLDRISIDCEPQTSSQTSGGLTATASATVGNWSNRLKSGSSPSPSSASSQSAEGRRFFNGPKFGINHN